MTKISSEAWWASLSTAKRARARKVLDVRPDLSSNLRADMSEEHAPLAFELLASCVFSDPHLWRKNCQAYVSNIADGSDEEFKREHGPEIAAMKEALARIVAAGATYEDLGTFASLLRADQFNSTIRMIAREGLVHHLPGWRLQELFGGEPTGRSLFEPRYSINK